MTLGKRISAQRLALGLSQNELARRAGVNHPTLYKIESDQRRNPSMSVVVRIALALGTSAEALLGLEREETRLLVESNKSAMVVGIRPLGQKVSDSARSRAQSFVASALERAGARVREAPSPSGDAASDESRLPAAGHLAAGGLALVDELQAVRNRLEALEAWRRRQEGRARKRASR